MNTNLMQLDPLDRNWQRSVRSLADSKRMRRGLTTLEVVVAASLLAASIGFLMPLALSTGKLWKETRQLRIASDVVVTELDVLSHVDPSQLSDRLVQLQVSDELKQILPGAKYTHRLSDDEHGVRIELSLDWDRGHPGKPVTFVSWNGRRSPGVDQ